MGYVRGTLNIGFVPVIFDQNDTDFIMETVEVVGFRYKDQVDTFPSVLEGEKLEVQDEVMASFVSQCLARRQELANNLEAAHLRTLQLINQHKRPMPSSSHQENIRNSIDRCQRIATLSGLLISFLHYDTEKNN